MPFMLISDASYVTFYKKTYCIGDVFRFYPCTGPDLGDSRNCPRAVQLWRVS